MASLWERVKKGLVVAAEKTDEFTKMGKLKIDIAGTHRKIEQNFEELGGKVYDITKTGKRKKAVTDDKDISKLIEKIKGLEKELGEKEEELNGLLSP